MRHSIEGSMLRSLLITADESTVRMVTRVFRDLEVAVDHISEAQAALGQVGKARYDAIVVDDHVEEVHIVFGKMLELPSCNKSVRIVLADPAIAMHAVFKAGTQVILYKPLSAERVRHGLRAVRNLMGRDRRRGATRIPTMLSARFTPRQSRGTSKQVLISDLSESGAAIQCKSDELPTSGVVNLEFTLPDAPDPIHCTAELVWTDNEGSAGVRFLDMPSYARRLLTEWLKEKAKTTAKALAMASRAGK